MNTALIGAFLSGLVVGAVAFAFVTARWIRILMNKRWNRILDESLEYHEGLWSAYNECLTFLKDNPDRNIKVLNIRLLVEIDRIEKILKFKNERANSLSQQDAIQEYFGEGK